MLSGEWFAENLRLVLVAVIGLVILLAALLSHDQPKKPAPEHKVTGAVSCPSYRHDKTIQVGSHRLAVEVADTINERAKGLGGRPCIKPDEGMLFIFDTPGVKRIWMKDMKFPIGIIWISQDHKVIARETNVSPSTYPDSFLNKDKPAQYVLEITADRADSLGLKLGASVDF